MKQNILSTAIRNTAKTPTKAQDYYKVTNSAGRNVIEITGYIGWYSDDAAWLKNWLRARENEDVEVFISSEGGSVFTGQSMYNALKAHKGAVNIYVEKAFSIASYVAMAGDNVKIVNGGQMFIHATSGYCDGTAADHLSHVELLKNAADAIAQAYTDKTNQSKETWLDVMKDDAGKYYTAAECVEVGLADEIIDASVMTNCKPKTQATPQPTQQPPSTAENNNQSESDMTELERQKKIRSLFNNLQVKLDLPFTLLNAALDDESCDIVKASQQFAAHTDADDGKDDPKNNGLGFGQNKNNRGYQGPSSDAKEMVKNVLSNRAGIAELLPDNKKYAGMDLSNAARALGVEGYGASVAENALTDATFKSVIGEIVQEVVHLEAQSTVCLVKELCVMAPKSRLGEYGVTPYDELSAFGERDAKGEFPENTFTGKARRKGNIVERGSQVLLTRAAIINDTFGVITDMPRQHVNTAYRSADKLLFQRVADYGAKSGLTAATIAQVLSAMSKALKSATTTAGDDLYYTGGLIMSNPALMETIQPLLATKTLTADNLNLAYNTFTTTRTATRLGDYILGFADGKKPLELAVLHGKEEPQLIENTAINAANGIGWTVVFDFDVQISDQNALTVGSVAAAKANASA